MQNKVKRIGILTNAYPPTKNGVSMAVYGLELELQKRGIEVFIATPEVEGAIHDDHVFCFPAVDLPKDISSDLKLAPIYTSKVQKFFESQKIDLIHTHDTLFGGIEGAFIAGSLDIPSVHTFHTLIEEYNMVSFPAYKRIIRRGIKEICNSYDAIISPSQNAYKYLLGLVSTPISQIYNVSYINSVVYEENYKFNLSSIKPEDFVFVTFCRCAIEKGLSTGLEILAPLMQKNKNIKYLVAGDGPAKSILIKQSQEFGIEDQLILVGAYNPEDLQSLVNNSQAKVFLFTSVTDNLPTNLLEAMHLGLPVLAINDPAVDYIVKDMHNGIITSVEELTNSAQKLIEDPELLNTLKINATQSAKEFLEQDIVGMHIKLYERVATHYEPNEDLIDLIIPTKLQKSIKETIEEIGNL